jgi:hypothetical protein
MVRENMLATADTVPKVYVALVLGSHGQPVVKTLFRPVLCRRLPGVVTPWDNQVYAFGTDIGPGNQITTVAFPGDAFHLTPAVTTLDSVSMTEAWVAAPEAHSLGPYVPGDPNTVPTRTRKLQVVPQAYARLLMGKDLTPRQAWITVATQVFADNRAVSCAPFIDWFRIAATLQPAVGEQQPRSVLLREPFMAPVPDHALARHRWNLVLMDMPQLAGATRTQDQAVMHAFHAMQQSQLQQAAAAQLERTESRAPKLPSSKFPATVQTLMRVAGATTEQSLPTFWHDHANWPSQEAQACSLISRKPSV